RWSAPSSWRTGRSSAPRTWASGGRGPPRDWRTCRSRRSSGCSSARRSSATAATSARRPGRSGSAAARCTAGSSTMASDRRRRPAGHESRVFVAALGAGLPAVLVAGWLLWMEPHSLRVRVTFTLLVLGGWLVGSALVRERVLRPLQTIANLLAALREGDYSIRARGAAPEDGLGLALL